MEVGDWRLEIGGWRLEVGGRRLEVGGRRLEVGDDFVVKTEVRQGRQGRIPSHGARRGLMRIMLREDYVEDKSIFELKKHTGICPTYIV